MNKGMNQGYIANFQRKARLANNGLPEYIKVKRNKIITNDIDLINDLNCGEKRDSNLYKSIRIL